MPLAFNSDSGESRLQGLVLFLPLRAYEVEFVAHFEHGRVDPLKGDGERCANLEHVVQQFTLAPGVEPGKLTERVLDLLAVPDLASPAQVVEIAAWATRSMKGQRPGKTYMGTLTSFASARNAHFVREY